MGLLPRQWLNAVVALGVEHDGEVGWMGTGFLVGHLYAQEGTLKLYLPFVVTNRHVLEGSASIVLRFDTITADAVHDFRFRLTGADGEATWVGHPDPSIDVAVFAVRSRELRAASVNLHYFKSDEDFCTVERMQTIPLTEGDAVFVLGFPMGLVSQGRKDAIVRTGSIARVQDLYAGASQTMILDAFGFPGNSGGPVIIRPELLSLDRWGKANDSSMLIGIAQSYIPYEEVAISAQTRETRVVFHSNSGLTLAAPVDHIVDTIQAWLTRNPGSDSVKPEGNP
ncbi:MAG: hypothetical protein C0501_20685 [Isosphaera sp.]|nr:hypothetical protein [Isosphaera sp.]